LPAKATLHTEPEGARVYWTAYRGDTAQWRYVGTTPIDSVPLPAGRNSVVLLLKFERNGYRTAVRPLGTERATKLPTVLDSVASPDSGMVRVRGGTAVVPNASRPGGDQLQYPDFLMDRTEVTNRRYKAFIAAQRLPAQSGTAIPDGAGASIRGTTSCVCCATRRAGPGPASWKYDILCREDYPVSGISWYEANAYARFAGKELPSIYHWRRAAQVGNACGSCRRQHAERDACPRAPSRAHDAVRCSTWQAACVSGAATTVDAGTCWGVVPRGWLHLR
jgi:hypothetical protein